MRDPGPDAAWRLLEYVSITDAVPVDADVPVDALLRAADIDFLVAKAVSHRLVAQLAAVLLDASLMAAVPLRYRRFLVEALHESRFVNAATTREAGRVVGALTEKGIPVVCTKGVVFQSTLYDNRGARSFHDVDLMTLPDDRDRVADTILSLGYLPHKDYDYSTDALVDRRRDDLIMYGVYPDHLPHFFRAPPDQFPMFHSVDVAFSLTWFGAAWQIPPEQVFRDTRRVPVSCGADVVELPALNEVYDFVFTALHLFRECWFERSLSEANLRLGQFADVWRQWRRIGVANTAELRRVIATFGLEPPVAWACHHVDSIFGSAIVHGLGLADYCHGDWLHSVRSVDDNYLRRSGGIRDWLLSNRVLPLLPGPVPPFAEHAHGGRP